jgi:hypothetical protein
MKADIPAAAEIMSLSLWHPSHPVSNSCRNFVLTEAFSIN